MAAKAKKYRTILLFGMPGSGKGTQGGVLGQLPDLVHVSCGDIFRKLPKYGELGREIVLYTSQGLMVPDDLTVRIWERYIKILELQELLLPDQHTLVLDGLPRTHKAGGRQRPRIVVAARRSDRPREPRRGPRSRRARGLCARDPAG